MKITTKDQVNEEATARFIQINCEIQEILKQLQNLADDHFGKSPDEIYWGDVEDLKRIKRKLDDALKLAKNEPLD